MTSDGAPFRRSCGVRYQFSSCYRWLAGAGPGFRCCPPGKAGSSEVRILRSCQLRRGGSRRRSGRGAVSSGERPLTGVAVPGISLPPVTGGWPELGADSDAVLRGRTARRRSELLRSRQLRRGGPRRQSGSGAVSSGERPLTGVAVPGISPSSCYRWLAGASRVIARCPPGNEASTENKAFRAHQLRRETPHRNNISCSKKSFQ